MVSKSDWLKKIGKWLIDQSSDNKEEANNNESKNYVNTQKSKSKIIDNNFQKEDPNSLKIPIDRAFKLFCCGLGKEGYKSDCFLWRRFKKSC